MIPTGPAVESMPNRVPSALRTVRLALFLQSATTFAITLGVLVAGAGIQSRWLILLGLLSGLSAAAGFALWLGRRVLAPMEQLVSQAEDLAAGRSPERTQEPECLPTSLHPAEWSRLACALAALQARLGSASIPVSPGGTTGVGAPGPGDPAQSFLFLSALLKTVPWALWIADRKGAITHHNALAVSLLESESTDLRGLAVEGWWTRWAGGASWQELQRTVAGGARWRGELELVTRDQRTARLEVTVVPLAFGAETSSMLFLAEDVTEIRQLGHLLIDLERQSTRGQMAGEVAHEINNFLTILGGNLDIIPMLLATGNHEKVEAKFAAMKQVLDKIARFSDGLMGHREDTSEAVPCDLNKLIVRLVDFLKPQNRFDGVAMVFQPDPALPDSCVRPGEIGQVLVNLLNNAADAIHLGGRREGRIEIAARRAPERDVVCITVRDNGPGLSNTAKSRIFRERYSEKKSGHGLGLLNCHAIARAHGGTLTVESAEGMGTTFTLTLPVASGESAPAAQTTAAATS